MRGGEPNAPIMGICGDAVERGGGGTEFAHFLTSPEEVPISIICVGPKEMRRRRSLRFRRYRIQRVACAIALVAHEEQHDQQVHTLAGIGAAVLE
jgi:hypothetical protein